MRGNDIGLHDASPRWNSPVPRLIVPTSSLTLSVTSLPIPFTIGRATTTTHAKGKHYASQHSQTEECQVQRLATCFDVFFQCTFAHQVPLHQDCGHLFHTQSRVNSFFELQQVVYWAILKPGCLRQLDSSFNPPKGLFVDIRRQDDAVQGFVSGKGFLVVQLQQNCRPPVSVYHIAFGGYYGWLLLPPSWRSAFMLFHQSRFSCLGNSRMIC